jgi:hypothetical protein
MFAERKLTHRWPEDYLQCLLQFLALDRPAKLAYLPSEFPEKVFHMGEADIHTGSPLIFMVQLAQDCCHAIAFPPGDERAQILRELRRLLELMSFSKDPFLWGMTLTPDQEDVVWDLVARLARTALTSLGWRVASPNIPCGVLLNEWSSGTNSDG